MPHRPGLIRRAAGPAGLYALLLPLMAGHLIVRSRSGRQRPEARATLEGAARMRHAAGVQALLRTALPKLLPRGLRVVRRR